MVATLDGPVKSSETLKTPEALNDSLPSPKAPRPSKVLGEPMTSPRTRPPRSCTSVKKATKDITSETPSKREIKEQEKAEKQAEKERLREQKKQELQERQAKREQAESEKEARRLQREKERLAKEEGRAKREEEKRARERGREEERVKREEERRVKEEERRAKEEERRQREAERAREEEEKRRKTEKQRAILMGFFVPQEKPSVPSSGGTEDATSTTTNPKAFMQFELKKDQRRAPLCRVASEKLAQLKWKNLEALRLSWQSKSAVIDGSRFGLTRFGQPNYLHELRTKQVKPLSSAATWPTEMPDVLCVGGNIPLHNSSSFRYNHGDPGSGGTVWTKVKLFQFVENYRPAYYGTWRRRSYVIKGRRPFGRDHLQLDYEVDSDDEWEEEEPGEDISQSEGEDEEDVEDEEDDDAKFLVPHGYLSDDEGIHDEDEEEEEEDKASGLPQAPGPSGGTVEMKKLRQRLSLAEYETAHRRGLQKLKPLLLGPVWSRNPLGALQASDSGVDYDVEGLEDNKENFDTGIFQSSSSTKDPKLSVSAVSTLPSKGEFGLMRSALNAYKVFLWSNTLPIVPQSVDATPETPSATPKTPSSGRPKKVFPEEAIPYLIQLVHRNGLSKVKLQFEFRAFWLKHTMGEQMSDSCCLNYREYKRRPEAESVTGGNNAPPTPNLRRTPSHQGATPPPTSILPLSKTQTMSKICEIAAFEEGQWRVKSDVLVTYKEALSALGAVNDPNSPVSTSSVTDPPFVLPTWSYLTDVATFKNRKSLPPVQVPVSAPSNGTSPQVVGSSLVPPSPQPSVSPIRGKQLSLAPGDISTNPSPIIRKRATLETFFSGALPAAKRKRTDDA